jgi:hypothetical protein
MDNNSQDIQDEILDLKTRRDRLVLSKTEHEMKLAHIKTMIRGERSIPPEKYRSILQSQDTHNRCLLRITQQLVSIKSRLRELGTDDYGLPHSVVAKLAALRAYYQDFAADPTRVNSMRQMAAEFVLKLNPIIKEALQGKAYEVT